MPDPETDAFAPARRPMRDLPAALDSMKAIASFAVGREPVFFLDYDGTLTPIVERPEDAHMPPATREVIRRLIGSHTVAVISGRDVSFVLGQVDVDGVVYAGSHGFDIVGPVGLETDKLEEFERFLPLIDAAEKALTQDLGDVPGARVERKKYSVAVHYRQVSDADVEVVVDAVDDAIRREPRLRKGLGKKVFEVRPDIEWDKGRAVLWLFDALGFDRANAVPFYIGDDITDEDAFEALCGLGIGIAVGEADRETAASFSVRDTQEVARFLDLMASGSTGGDA